MASTAVPTSTNEKLLRSTAGFELPEGYPSLPRSPSPTRTSDSAGWGHWMSDGLYGTGDLPNPRTRYTVAPHAGGIYVAPSSTSILDGAGNDRTKDLPRHEETKAWTGRSMMQMADGGAVPAGLPTGLSDNEKKLWLAIYCRARQILKDGSKPSVRAAADAALDDVTEKHSLEYRFGVRWLHSVKTCLAMRQEYRSLDVYS